MENGRKRVKTWLLGAVLVVQLILLLAHGFLYFTWTAFWPSLGPAGRVDLGIALLILACVFVFATLLSFRYSNPAVALFYHASAIWLGFSNFLFLAAIATWPVWLIVRLAHADAPQARMWTSGSLTALAIAAGIYGLVNARVIRVRRHTVRLPNLPDAWRGRRAVLLSYLHLGNINGIAFSRRVAQQIARLEPDIVFLPGDLFDGTHVDADRLLAPFGELKPPLGIYYSTGNHEEFGDPARYTEPVARAGFRVLASERVTVDGLDIVGLAHHDSVDPWRMRTLLEHMNLDGVRPSILLNHVPSYLAVVEQAGVSLQLSGHTHRGQIFPYNLLARRVFGRFVHGLNRLDSLQVYTSSGAGTWGPPMRVATSPEIVALEFDG